MTHELKTWPEPFEAVRIGQKQYEIRKADRPYGVGDTLKLREYDPEMCIYTGRAVSVRVKYMTPPGKWGLPPDTCVMSVELLPRQP